MARAWLREAISRPRRGLAEGIVCQSAMRRALAPAFQIFGQTTLVPKVGSQFGGLSHGGGRGSMGKVSRRGKKEEPDGDANAAATAPPAGAEAADGKSGGADPKVCPPANGPTTHPTPSAAPCRVCTCAREEGRQVVRTLSCTPGLCGLDRPHRRTLRVVPGVPVALPAVWDPAAANCRHRAAPSADCRNAEVLHGCVPRVCAARPCLL